MRAATAADATLQSLLSTVKSGWPADKKDLPACLHPYRSMQDEISYDQVLLLKGQRIIVPTACHKAIHNSLHDSAHLGIESCLHHARDTAFWPGTNADLKAYIQACPTSVPNINLLNHLNLQHSQPSLPSLGKLLVPTYSP